MLSAGITIAIYLVGLVFAAGVAHARAERLKKDVNGVGARVKTIEKDSSDRHARMCMALMAIAPEEKKQLVIDCLGGKQP